MEEKQGDAFELVKTHAVVHCISRDAALGKGFALTASLRNRDLTTYLKREIANNKLTVPSCVYYEGKTDKIFNLITKELYWHKPTMLTMKGALLALKEQCEMFGIKSLVMPEIGCHLDRLHWPSVRDMINEIFDESYDIKVRNL